MNDALNNPIILGETYGASYANSGITTIVVGKAIKIGKAKTTIEAESVRYLDSNRFRWCPIEVGTKHPIFHERLFPVKVAGDKLKLQDIEHVIKCYNDDFFNDGSGVTTIDVLRAENPDLINSLEDALRKFVGY